MRCHAAGDHVDSRGYQFCSPFALTTTRAGCHTCLSRLFVQGLLSAADEEQVRLMEEQVIVTDYNDNCIGAGSKKTSML